MTEAGTFPLPANLPVPEDTGACVHLPGHPMPPLIELASTAGGIVDLFLLSLSRPVLVFVYPRTASPGEEVPESWNALPGARGCTPELCSIRDGLQPLVEREPTLAIFGLSVQPTAIQQEAATGLRLPYALLSDETLALQKALDLPTLQWQGRTFLQRVTLLLKEGQITQVHYPVFPPDKAAAVALQMLNGSRHPCVPENCEEADGEAEVAEAEEASLDREAALHQAPETAKADELAAQTTTTAAVEPVPRPRLSSRAPSDWRNSLVAIDNETGQVIGVVASNVVLDADSLGREEPSTPEEEDVNTPLDGVALGPDEPFFTVQAPTPTKKSATQQYVHEEEEEEKEEEEEEQLATPRRSVLYGAAHVYIDEDNRPPSRSGSVLGEATFAPPPVPTKPKHLRQPPAPRPQSMRSSMASANFFSARETSDDEPDADDDDDDDDDDDEQTTGVHEVAYGEAHRPDLLRDVNNGNDDDDDDAGNRSDASGSTVGGPAVKLWRKARGGKEGEKKRMAKKEAKKQEKALLVMANVAPTTAAKRREPSQRSVESVRTSRAETANEGLFSDADDEDEPTIDANAQRLSIVDPLREPEMAAAAPEPAPEAQEFDENRSHVRGPTSATVKAMRAHGHRPRALMATTEIRSVEDRVWQDALETESLPIDAPYTHLAVQSKKDNGHSAQEQDEDGAGAGEEQEEDGLELMAKGERPRINAKGNKNAKTRATETRAGKALQGNSVLIEFLAGSRIAASVINADVSSLVPDARPPSSLQGPTVFSPTSVGNIEREGAMRYIPVLPQHLLWFFGFSAKETQPSLPAKDGVVSGAAEDRAATVAPSPAIVTLLASALDPSTLVSAATHGATSALESLTNMGWSAGEWLGSSWSGLMHGHSHKARATGTAGAPVPSVDEDDVDEDAEEWEWTVPEFDPMSLAGTPRPIYRRKKPSPSHQAGFQIRQQGQSIVEEEREPSIDEGDVAGTVIVKETLLGGTPGTRYSIVHYDDYGVGRRALLRR